ncbi:MAG: hypothetical protein NTX64_14260 [Elusimicrobia bacterium]|nr:hypothetical protein [Elusimicrobiota bacterium]
MMASLWLAAVYSDVARDMTRTWLEAARESGRTFIAQTVVPGLKTGFARLQDKAFRSAARRRPLTSPTTAPRG